MADEFNSAPINQPIVDNSAPNQTEAAPVGVNVVNPSGELVSIPQEHLQDALDNGYSQATSEDINKATTEAKYGSTAQGITAAAEGAFKGVAGPVATWLETAYGVKPEDIKGREEAHPVAHGLAEASTFAGSLLTGEGEAALLGKAGKAFEGTMGLERATKLQQMTAEASKAAFEGLIYGAGEEAHKRILNDPSQGAESVIANVGISALLTGAFGAAVGGLSKLSSSVASHMFIPEVDKAAMIAGDIPTTIKLDPEMAEGTKSQLLDAFKINKLKKNAPELVSAAKELGVDLPIGAKLDSELIKRNIDALRNSPYTLSGNSVKEDLDRAWNMTRGALESNIASTSTASVDELGSRLAKNLTDSTREAYAPIQQAFDGLVEHYSQIPVKDAAASLSKGIRDLPEFALGSGTDAGQLANKIINIAKNVDTAEKLTQLKGLPELKDASTPGFRDALGPAKTALRDAITEVQESSVKQFAKSFPRNDEAGAMFRSLIQQADAAKEAYKPYIKKLGTFIGWTGKNKISGTEGALHYIGEHLSPTELANRLLTASKDPQFVSFAKKEYPSIYEELRQFKRAALLDKAQNADGVLDPRKFLRAFHDEKQLPKEVKSALYAPEELKKIAAANTIFNGEAFPKTYNGSGTSHTDALREAYSNPKSMITANIRDLGMKKVIELAERTSEGKQAIALANATVSGERLTYKSVRNLFKIDAEMPAAIVPNIANRVKLDKLVQSYLADPSKMVAMNDNHQSVPEYSTAFAAAGARVVQYLANLKPDTKPKNPMDRERPANAFEKSAYNRAMDIAEQPLVVLKAVKDGRITPTDIIALRTMYPSLYQNIAQKMMDSVSQSVHKGEIVPYKTRMGLSLFLGQPLDSTMTPQAIMSAQVRNQSPSAKPGEGQPQRAPSAASMKGMSKLPQTAMTPAQQRESARATGKH